MPSNRIEQLDGKIATIQVDFEPIFWTHDDPEVILSFAEKKVDSLEPSSFIRYSSRTPIEGCQQSVFGRFVLDSRKVALELIGTHDLIVQQHRLLENGKESIGAIADIFTIESTKKQLGISPSSELGGGMTALHPVSRFKVKQIKEKPNG